MKQSRALEGHVQGQVFCMPRKGLRRSLCLTTADPEAPHQQGSKGRQSYKVPLGTGSPPQRRGDTVEGAEGTL